VVFRKRVPILLGRPNGCLVSIIRVLLRVQLVEQFVVFVKLLEVDLVNS
jgi:hypothetical protein